MWPEYPVNEMLESGKYSKQTEAKCDEFAQIIQSGEGHIFLRLYRQENLPTVPGEIRVVKKQAVPNRSRSSLTWDMGLM